MSSVEELFGLTGRVAVIEGAASGRGGGVAQARAGGGAGGGLESVMWRNGRGGRGRSRSESAHFSRVVSMEPVHRKE